ncbi:phosphatase PAP2 family protein [Pyrococcus sp. ST04]|uniref:phosphatase PAP2 family protein n=1 Tax=Pyrococcus sp. ST04 TaxID=1183377 RepID=UPI0002605DBE|nr:phosphatase PAP2 family protein [Pyrococcus sp. ST04]AFK23117.1 putative membrane-associated phosphatase [Pyrococcus sp. ST04]
MRKRLVILTLILIIIGTLEWIGAFKEVNIKINNLIPKGGTIALLITTLGDFIVVFLMITAAIAVQLKKEKLPLEEIIRPYLSLILTTLSVGVLKIIFGVPRPGVTEISDRIKDVKLLAFPSGHTARTSGFARYLMERFPKYKIIWVLLPLSVGISRLLLHVHWFSDVLFGFFYGPWIAEVVKTTQDIWARPIRRLEKWGLKKY